MDIQQFISGLTAQAGTSEDDCATIQYWDPDAEEGAGSLVSLVYSTDAMDPMTLDPSPAWADGQGFAATLPITPGFTCWIRVPYGAANITFAGQVNTLATTPTTVTRQWQLAGNPYPTTTKFNGGKMTTNIEPQAGTSESDCATIQYWEPDAEEGAGSLVSLVYSSDAMDPMTLDPSPAWADGQGFATDAELGPCTGFWIIAPTDATCGTLSWSL